MQGGGQGGEEEGRKRVGCRAGGRREGAPRERQGWKDLGPVNNPVYFVCLLFFLCLFSCCCLFVLESDNGCVCPITN